MSPIRVMVVDDHTLFRRGLVEVLSEDDDIEVVGEAGDGKEAIVLAAEVLPDVVFMDLKLPDQNGIETTAYLTQRWPELKVLILTASEEPADLMRALGVGARGYILKNIRPREIVDALRQTYEGFALISPALAPRLKVELSQSGIGAAQPGRGGAGAETELTTREQEILQLVARGLSNADIADAVVVTVNTVKTHMKNILGKLHTKNRYRAVDYATKLGYLRSGPDHATDGGT